MLTETSCPTPAAASEPCSPSSFTSALRARARRGAPRPVGVRTVPDGFRTIPSELRSELPALRRELMARALRFVRSAASAEDIVQETMARALRFEEQYQPGTNLRAWLGQILRSVFLTQCRRDRRELRALGALERDPCSWLQSEPPPPTMALSPRPACALASLAPGYRAVIHLVDVEGLSYREAADELRIPVGTVMSRLHRGRRLLAERLGEAVGAVAPLRPSSAPVCAAA